MRKLLVILVTFLLMVNGTGCSLLGIGNVKKRYTLEERRAAVMQYLEEKYGEKFIEISVEPEGVLASYDTFHMYPQAGTKEDKFTACCSRTSKGLTISDGYFGVLIHDQYEELMNEIVGQVCDEFFVEVSTQPDATFSGRYNRDTDLSELYQKGDIKNYTSSVWIHIKESSANGRSIGEILQPIAQTMLDRQLLGYIIADIIKDEKYDELKGKSTSDIYEITNRRWREFYVYPQSQDDPARRVYIIEDKESGSLVIKYY